MKLPPNIEDMKVKDAVRALGGNLPRQCEHIKANGQFCGSPALRDRNYCFFHLTHIGRRLRAERAHERALQSHDRQSAALELPPLEDSDSIQVALMQVIDAILHERLETKRAGLVLYALQTASSNLANGASFLAPKGATVAGGYEAFEEDYELGEDAPELKVVEDLDEVEEEEDQEEEELEAEEGNADDADEDKEEVEKTEEAAAVAASAGEASPAMSSASSAATTVAPACERSCDDNDIIDDPNDTELCNPLNMFLCSFSGPLAGIYKGRQMPGRSAREASSQRLSLGRRKPSCSIREAEYAAMREEGAA